MAAKKTTSKPAAAKPAAAKKPAAKKPAPAGSGIPLKTLIVATDDGKLYKLPEEVYTDPKFAISEVEAGPATQLLAMGTTLAFIPQSVGVGIGSICYVVNLGSLRTDHLFGDGKK